MQAEAEEQRAREAEERLEEESRQRLARLPRHYDLELEDVAINDDNDDKSCLRQMLKDLAGTEHPRRVGGSIEQEERIRDERALEELREELEGLVVRGRAKVTDNRIYSMAYHPDPVRTFSFFSLTYPIYPTKPLTFCIDERPDLLRRQTRSTRYMGRTSRPTLPGRQSRRRNQRSRNE